MIAGTSSPSAQEREVLLLEFLFDRVLHDVLDNRCPTAHLISLFSDSLLPRHSVDLLSVSLFRIKTRINFTMKQYHKNAVLELNSY